MSIVYRIAIWIFPGDQFCFILKLEMFNENSRAKIETNIFIDSIYQELRKSDRLDPGGNESFIGIVYFSWSENEIEIYFFKLSWIYWSRLNLSYEHILSFKLQIFDFFYYWCSDPTSKKINIWVIFSLEILIF